MAGLPSGMPDRSAIEVSFWGTRGSIPVPGPLTLEFGGNTTSIEVSIPQGKARSSIIIDAGSGIRNLGESREWLSGQTVHLLLTHLHHDHILGLAFFRAAYVKGLNLHIWCGNLEGADAGAALEQMFSPPLFPFRPSDLPATLIFHGFRAGETIRVDGHDIATTLLNHPSGATGYRFEAPAGALAVVTDLEHRARDDALVAFCAGVDTLVYDMMLDACEYGRCKGWGHSTAEEAVKLIGSAQGRRLIGFHHGPGHTDEIMSRREAALQALWPVSLMAREGQTLVCEAGAKRSDALPGKRRADAVPSEPVAV